MPHQSETLSFKQLIMIFFSGKTQYLYRQADKGIYTDPLLTHQNGRSRAKKNPQKPWIINISEDLIPEATTGFEGQRHLVKHYKIKEEEDINCA